jgi:hypothetical protein
MGIKDNGGDHARASGITAASTDKSNKTTYDVAGYEAFRQRAKDLSLSANEKSGFPDAYRCGQSGLIFADICRKLTSLNTIGARVLDIGPGCGELAGHIIVESGRRQQELTVIDSPEMLALLPNAPHVTRVEGPFPACLTDDRGALGLFDAILAYSVAQYVFAEGNLFAFVDAAAGLLYEGGEFLIGDIPNATMRKRFMTSGAGERYHREHYADLAKPEVTFNKLEAGQIDDGVIVGLISRMRNAGFHSFVLPQDSGLPMANRREDILIRRP